MSEQVKTTWEIRRPVRCVLGLLTLGAAMYAAVIGGVNQEAHDVAGDVVYGGTGSPYQMEYNAGAAGQQAEDDETAARENFAAAGILLVIASALTGTSVVRRRFEDTPEPPSEPPVVQGE